MNDDISAHARAQARGRGRTPHQISSAGRLLESLESEGTVGLQRLAHDIGVRVEVLESCRRGDARLPHELQMRLAAVTLLHAPQLTRQARALYAQAQAALRLEAGEVARHRTYPNGPFEALPQRNPRPTSDDEAVIVADRRPHEPSCADALVRLREQVTRTAQALRASGETPEHALVLVKTAVEPTLTGAVALRREVMESVVRWFVEAYYGA